MRADRQSKQTPHSTPRAPQRALPLAMASIIGSIVGGVTWAVAMNGDQSPAMILVGAVIAIASALLGLAAVYRIVSNLDDTAVRVYEITDGLYEQR